MRKTIATLALTVAGLGLAGGVAAADDGQTVIVNESSSTSTGSASCAPASLLAQFPWLPVPTCP